jgi:hypothetical protein
MPRLWTETIEEHRQEVRDAILNTTWRLATEQGCDVRDDIAPDELARYCLHALTAAGSAKSKASVDRLVGLIMDAVRPR